MEMDVGQNFYVKKRDAELRRVVIHVIQHTKQESMNF